MFNKNIILKYVYFSLFLSLFSLIQPSFVQGCVGRCGYDFILAEAYWRLDHTMDEFCIFRTRMA